MGNGDKLHRLWYQTERASVEDKNNGESRGVDVGKEKSECVRESESES